MKLAGIVTVLRPYYSLRVYLNLISSKLFVGLNN